MIAEPLIALDMDKGPSFRCPDALREDSPGDALVDVHGTEDTCVTLRVQFPIIVRTNEIPPCTVHIPDVETNRCARAGSFLTHQHSQGRDLSTYSE